jgi:hypothetical protein
MALSTIALAQQIQRYTAPRTPHGHPDLQGVWATEFVTRLERPPGVDYLVASPEQAKASADIIRSSMPVVHDPQINLDDVTRLAMVKGEYRTSIIVDPPNGRMPFTHAGTDLVAWVEARNVQSFDHPEQRPLRERCMENYGYAPIRAIPVLLPRQILQTGDHVVIVSDDTPGPRIIHLTGASRSDVLRSIDGYSRGHWEKDTLVVQTTHLRAEDPARHVLGRPLLLSPRSKITERFTRVSETELFYRFTVDDKELYTQPWTGEFSMTLYHGPILEYACHEGNYSMPNMLRGGQAEAAAMLRHQQSGSDVRRGTTPR